jgi:hypothetical protein
MCREARSENDGAGGIDIERVGKEVGRRESNVEVVAPVWSVLAGS